MHIYNINYSGMMEKPGVRDNSLKKWPARVDLNRNLLVPNQIQHRIDLCRVLLFSKNFDQSVCRSLLNAIEEE